MGSIGVFGPRWHNLGAAMAIVAGLMLFAFTTWPTPGPPGSMGGLTAVWATVMRVLGVIFIFSPFFVSRIPAIVKGVLLIGSIVLAAVALTSAIGGGDAVAAVVFHILPALFALGAAFVIGPRSRPEVERAEQAEL